METERNEAKAVSYPNIEYGTEEYQKFIADLEVNLKEALYKMKKELTGFSQDWYGQLYVLDNGAVQCQIKAKEGVYKIYPFYEYGNTKEGDLMDTFKTRLDQEINVTEEAKDIIHDISQCLLYIKVN